MEIPIANIIGLMEAFYTYILRSIPTGRYYIGQTNNLKARLARHNAGSEKSTRTYAPWIVVYSKEFDSRSQAVKLERYLKALKSRKRIEDWIRSHAN